MTDFYKKILEWYEDGGGCGFSIACHTSTEFDNYKKDILTYLENHCGADIEATDDGMIIQGGKSLHGAHIHTAKDHRIAMSFAIASLLTDDEVTILDPECVNISFPDFYEQLYSLY